MASRRPPLFELLQHDESPRPGRGSGNGHSSHTGLPGQAPTKTSNGRAEGAVETKPTSPAKGTTIEDLGEPASKPKPEPRPRPEVVRVPAPQPAKASTEEAQKPERAAGAADWSGMHPKSAVRVRMIWVYGTLVAVMAVVVGVWMLGYTLGVSNEKAKLEPYLTRGGQPGPIADPMSNDSGESGESSRSAPGSLLGSENRASNPTPLPGIDRQASPRRVDPAPPVIEPEPAPVRPQPRAVNVLVDVRQAGNNYLKLASGMALDRAKGLAEHLSANGVHAMAIDEGRQGFGLYTAFAVPSGQYRTMGEQRREHEAQVVRLLGSTPQEAGGPYTPRDQLWMRFDG